MDKVIEEYIELEKEELDIVNQKNEILVKSEVFEIVKALEEKANEIATKKEEMKTSLKEAMENNNVKKFENDIISVTYVAPTTRVGVDTEKLKTEYEEVYLDCLKETSVKSSIRLKIK